MTYLWAKYREKSRFWSGTGNVCDRVIVCLINIEYAEEITALKTVSVWLYTQTFVCWQQILRCTKWYIEKRMTWIVCGLFNYLNFQVVGRFLNQKIVWGEKKENCESVKFTMCWSHRVLLFQVLCLQSEQGMIHLTTIMKYSMDLLCSFEQAILRACGCVVLLKKTVSACEFSRKTREYDWNDQKKNTVCYRMSTYVVCRPSMREDLHNSPLDLKESIYPIFKPTQKQNVCSRTMKSLEIARINFPKLWIFVF